MHAACLAYASLLVRILEENDEGKAQCVEIWGVWTWYSSAEALRRSRRFHSVCMCV
jgi:hypothetical protein